MPMRSPIKTYSRLENKYISEQLPYFPVSEASTVVDALLAKNIEKRNISLKSTKKMRTRAKKKQDTNSTPTSPTVPRLLIDDSINVKVNSTFDDLFQGSIYNSVKYCNVSSLYSNSGTENSVKIEKHISPYNTRNVRKKNYAKIHNANSCLRRSKASGKINKKNTKTLKKKITKALKCEVKNITSKNIHRYLDESVNYSLIIEKIPKKSVDFQTVPPRKFTPVSSTSHLAVTNLLRNSESSYIFRNGFRHCMQADNAPKFISTPIVPRCLNLTKDKLLDVSPIKSSDSSFNHCKTQLFEKSLGTNLTKNQSISEHFISNTPNKSAVNSKVIAHLINNSSVKSAQCKNSSAMEKSRVLSARFSDPKLNAIPRVVIENNLDLLGISGKVSLFCSLRKSTKNNLNESGLSPAKNCYPQVILDKLSISTLKNIEGLNLNSDSYDKLSAHLRLGSASFTHEIAKNSEKSNEVDIIENSQSPQNFITKRKRRKPNTAIQPDSNAKKPCNISLHEWERFSQSIIKLIKIDNLPEYSAEEPEIIESSQCAANLNKKSTPECITLCDSRYENKTIFLRPGKHWFRSLSILRKSNVHVLDSTCNKGRKWRESVSLLFNQQDCAPSALSSYNQRSEICNSIVSNNFTFKRPSLKIVDLSQNGGSIIEESARVRKSGYVPIVADESVLEESFTKLSLSTNVSHPETARQIVLKRCGQTTPILFHDCYSQRILKRCRKIGEGVYGEVFMYKSFIEDNNQCRVMKVIPIEGSQVVNGEHQKKFEEILSEIVIASELSGLRSNTEFCTDGYAELLKICCVQGKYPQELLDLWDLYDEERGSENDSPEIFADDQLYIILELANGGQDLESYSFKNAVQSYALFVQVVSSLAVAESSVEFEHRDMHWGNLLIKPTSEATVFFRLNGREFEVATKGVKLSIIDFTLSRMTYKNNCCIYNDLALDPDLFSATGDYQFEIYRLMRERNRNDWQRFEPYSNILWLDYTLEKIVNHLRYTHVSSKTHKTFLRKLAQLRKKILNFNSVTELLNSDIFSHVFL